jgi:hypothetical protein
MKQKKKIKNMKYEITNHITTGGKADAAVQQNYLFGTSYISLIKTLPSNRLFNLLLLHEPLLVKQTPYKSGS